MNNSTYDFDALTYSNQCARFHAFIPDFTRVYTPYHYLSIQVICILGLIGHVIIIRIIRNHLNQVPINGILLCMSLVHMPLLVSCVAYSYVTHLSERTCQPQYWSWFWTWFRQLTGNVYVICHSVIVWLVVSLSVVRVVKLTLLPAEYKIRHWHCVIACALGTAIASALSIPVISWTTVTMDPNASTHIRCSIANWTKLLVNHQIYGVTQASWTGEPFVRLARRLYLSGCKLIPCVIVAVTTMVLATKLIQLNRRQRSCRSNSETLPQRHYGRTTMLVISVASMCMAVEFPQVIMMWHYDLYGGALVRCYVHLGEIFELSEMLYSSVTIVLFCVMSGSFRQQLIRMFCCDAKRDQNANAQRNTSVKRCGTSTLLHGSNRINHQTSGSGNERIDLLRHLPSTERLMKISHKRSLSERPSRKLSKQKGRASQGQGLVIPNIHIAIGDSDSHLAEPETVV